MMAVISLYFLGKKGMSLKILFFFIDDFKEPFFSSERSPNMKDFSRTSVDKEILVIQEDFLFRFYHANLLSLLLVMLIGAGWCDRISSYFQINLADGEICQRK